VTSLQEYATLAQIAGSVAVVASLIFVAVSIRHNTTTARARTLQANLMFWQDFFARMADPESGRVYARGASGRHDLTAEEFGQFFFQCRTIFMGCENQHYQFTQGLIDADAYRGYEATIREQIATQPGVRAMWSLQRHSYGTTFQRFFDDQIARAERHKDRSIRSRWKEALQRERPPGGSVAAGGVGLTRDDARGG
jgi:hypothetical protein